MTEWLWWWLTLYLWEWFPLLESQWCPIGYFRHWWLSIGWGFVPRSRPWCPFRTILFSCRKSIWCGRFSMHPNPSSAISYQVLWHISSTESTSKFLPTVWMKIFSMSHDIIHQVDYVAPFDDLTVMDKFSMLVPTHGRFSLNAFQEAFSFSSVFYGNCSDDFGFLDSVGFC